MNLLNIFDWGKKVLILGPIKSFSSFRDGNPCAKLWSIFVIDFNTRF